MGQLRHPERRSRHDLARAGTEHPARRRRASTSVKEGDTLEAVAGRFKVKPDDILLWPGNHLDLADPKLTPGE